jgi:urease accessory protein UreE
VEGGDRRLDLEHRERERSKMRCRLKRGEGQVVELTEGAAMATVVATNLVVAAILRHPAVDER